MPHLPSLVGLWKHLTEGQKPDWLVDQWLTTSITGGVTATGDMEIHMAVTGEPPHGLWNNALGNELSAPLHLTACITSYP